MSTNDRLAASLQAIATMMDLLGEDPFRSAAHARAARAVLALADDITTLANDRAKLLAIQGIGPKTADKIIEFCQTGAIAEEGQLRAKVPAGLFEVLSLQGVGPKTVRAMWQTLGVTDVASLERTIADGTLKTLPRMGDKAVEKIRQAIGLASQSAGRVRLGQAWAVMTGLRDRLLAHRAVARVEHAGSLRRGRETVGDLDLLVEVRPGHEAQASKVMEHLRAAPGVGHVLTAGENKTSVLVSLGEAGGKAIQADVRVVPRESFGAALQYFTGSKEHNVRLRALAQSKGLTLNEWGLFAEGAWKAYHDASQKKGSTARPPKPVCDCSREEHIYAHLGVTYVPPELREDRGEFDLRATPALVEAGDIVSELHAHTTASDGVLSIEELALGAKERGFHTIAVTDHSQSSTIARGLKPDRLREHIEAVRRANATLGKNLGIAILAGSEVDILADGSLDYADSLLEQLDIVVASPHAALTQPPADATKRLLRAVAHPRVKILGHPSGRLINSRGGLEPDWKAIFAAAKERGVALEINSHWMRLDLRDTHARAAVEAGCLIAIDCDVHHPDDFDNLRFGVATARRGWVTKERCVNTWTREALMRWLGG